MNYPESKKIFSKIKNSRKVLINCHSSPDPDSVGSALAMYQVVKELGKRARVICPDKMLDNLIFLPNSKKIEKVDFGKFDFSPYDLFLVLDSASPDIVTGDGQIKFSKHSIVVIDHHRTNCKFGSINIVDENSSSTAELLYKIFKDWGIDFGVDIATCLLTGIIGDTYAFEYYNTSVQTFQIAIDLINKGVDKDKIITELFRSKDFNLLKFCGEVVQNMKVDEKFHFVWSAVSYKDFIKYLKPREGRELAASMYAGIIKETKFGLVAVEEKPRTIRISLRSRGDFDVSRVALELGGGGHKLAAGATLGGLKFKEAVDKILLVSRKFAKLG